MVGRAAQGRPWIFREIAHYLATGEKLPAPLVSEIHAVLVAHLHDLHAFYGRETGVKVARKHISWYTKGLAGSASFRHRMNQLQTCEEQLQAVNEFFDMLASEHSRLQYAEEELGRMKQTSEIADCVRRSLERYFKDLDGAKPRAIYDMVLRNVERPMLEIVLDRAQGNQTIAAEMLGINRNTLRKKIQSFKIKA